MGADTTTRNIIGQGTTIKGDLVSNGDFRIDGQLTGTIRCDGKIVIGHTGVVEGDVFCKQADVSGKMKAKLEVAEITVLKATANFNGELVTAKIAIEVGAMFSGKCQMKNAVESKTHATSQTTKN
jgi:cytoskeletal protein CcmA (bactofilin family)